MKTIRLSRLLFERYTTESENLTNILNKHNIPYEILENTKDIWMRDFMPFCLDDGTLVSYIYEPDYLQGVKYKNIKTKINYEINHIDLVIDGGNFVRYKNKAIMTDKVFKENPSKTKDEIIEIIKIIDRISGTEFDSFDLLQIDKKYLLHRRRLSAEFETIECFF